MRLTFVPEKMSSKVALQCAARRGCVLFEGERKKIRIARLGGGDSSAAELFPFPGGVFVLFAFSNSASSYIAEFIVNRARVSWAHSVRRNKTKSSLAKETLRIVVLIIILLLVPRVVYNEMGNELDLIVHTFAKLFLRIFKSYDFFFLTYFS